MMTPQDKALDLITKMYWALPNNGSWTGINSVQQRWEDARRCTEIGVQEMVNEISSMQKIFPEPDLFDSYVEYWQETLEAVKTQTK